MRVFIPFPSGRPQRPKVLRALARLQEWGVEASCPWLDSPERGDGSPDYLCGPDTARQEELLEAWTAPDVEAVWCGRGGYGATRLLHRLPDRPWTDLRPKLLLGYSDITALFAYIRHLQLPITTIHAPVLTELPDHPEPERLQAALQGRPTPLPVSAPSDRLVGFQAPIWGGNLAVLASLCGTPWLPRNLTGAILLEDVDEAPYRLDRFVTQLADSDFFLQAQGVLLGQFTRCGSGLAGREAVARCLSERAIPVLGHLQVGHEATHHPVFLDRPYRYEPQQATLIPAGSTE